MTAAEPGSRPGLLDRLRLRQTALLASRGFQSWAARFPLTKTMARRDGERLFDLVAGFTYSQVLQAVVVLRLPDLLAGGPKTAASLALETGMDPGAMDRLCRAASGLKLLKRQRDGRYRLARLGAALRGVPGLPDMIEHHAILYRDLADPVGFLRGETEPELARFWPYVFGAGAAGDPETAARYSRLMTDSQALVAEETLKAVDLSDVRVLMDVGGGTGAFLRAAIDRFPHLRAILVDLPAVPAPDDPRIEKAARDFRTEALPDGADAISLVRVLYDHADATVDLLLSRVFDSLPSGGRLIVSEPMSGGDDPNRAGDVYFALYCMAMGTGCVRSPMKIGEMLKAAGFADIRMPRVDRPFVTGIVTARRP
ncbi:SAM-dependent methyltransferase [Rhodobacterales bacterium HKCCE3408]|nr:SAM-dependent methyltransferase [Rhodobacterales bacterium HKCCE3408]